MEKKERIKDFNQHIITILNKFIVNAQPVEGLEVEYYAFTLHASIVMFIKRTSKTTMTKNFTEANKVEKKMLTLIGNLGGEDNKTLVVGKKPLLLTKIAEKEPTNLEGVLKLVKKMSNEVVD
jgi:hypothetical protein